MTKDLWGFIEPRDAAHNAAFYSIALFHDGQINNSEEYMWPVISMLLRNFLFPIKHPTYVWSNTEDWRKWLWMRFLSWFNVFGIRHIKHRPARYFGQPTYVKKSPLDFYAGSNPDQLGPCVHYFAIKKYHIETVKIVTGLILRAGFFPNGEHILFKPQFLSPIFRQFHIPLYWITDLAFWVSANGDLDEHPCKSTTNKIRMYLFLCQAEESPTIFTKWIKDRIEEMWGSTEEFFKTSFWYYWRPGSDKEAISLTMPYDLLS